MTAPHVCPLCGQPAERVTFPFFGEVTVCPCVGRREAVFVPSTVTWTLPPDAHPLVVEDGKRGLISGSAVTCKHGQPLCEHGRCKSHCNDCTLALWRSLPEESAT